MHKKVKRQHSHDQAPVLPQTTRQIALSETYYTSDLAFCQVTERIISMENIITRTSEQFGTIRTIEGTPQQLWCGIDVAKALGYSNTRDAVSKHCRCVVKRDVPHPQSKNRAIQMTFIPEADVYRLICHSKLPKAQEFEKWVFEDVVPDAVHGDEVKYEYFDKTYRGEPVLSVIDICMMTGAGKSQLDYYLRTKSLKKGTDYYRLEAETLLEFKKENPKVSKLAACMNIVTKSGFNKLAKVLQFNIEKPKCFDVPRSMPTEPKRQHDTGFTVNRAVVSLLLYIERDTMLVDAYRKRLLESRTEEEAKYNKLCLAKALRELRHWVFDTETIIVN